MGRLEEKRVLVTAAAHGIGRASVLALAAEGARVLATDIDEEVMCELASVPGIDTQRLDVTSSDEINALAEKLDSIDVLFNCAGFVHQGTLLDCSEADWDFSFNLNVKSMFNMIRTFLPGMLSKKGGSIINMASVASSEIAAPSRCAYGATKAAVIGLTKSVAADYFKDGIRCNAICPGTVDSPSLQQRMRDLGDYETARASFLARQPTGKLAQPDDIASLVVFLASDESSFMTGEAVRIDGGWSNT